MYKLYCTGINGKLWRLIMRYYSNYTCSVLYKGCLSDEFDVKQGVHQGGVLSMSLFCVFINDLLDELRRSDIGCAIKGIKITCPAYADDIALIAPFTVSIQHLVNIVTAYCTKWQLCLNPQKCVYIDTNPKPKEVIKVYGDVIVQKPVHDHVGIPVLSSQILDDKAGYISSRISAARRCFNSCLGIIPELQGLNPVSFSKLYWAIVMPKLVYGLFLVPISISCIHKIETFHIACAKRIQGLPMSTPSEGVLPQLGWVRIKTHLDRLKLLFIFHIVNMDDNSIVKDIFIKRLRYLLQSPAIKSFSPVSCIIKCVRLYGLLDDVLNSLNLGAPYCVMSKSMWMNYVDKTLNKHEHSLWRSNVGLFPKLSVYKSIITCIEPCIWWRLAQSIPRLSRHCKVVVKMLCGTYGFMKSMYKMKARDKYCVYNDLCNTCKQKSEDIIHCVICCDGYVNYRIEIYKCIQELCDIDMCDLSESNRLLYLLSAGMNGNHIIKVSPLTTMKLAEAIAKYMYKIHKQRLYYINM